MEPHSQNALLASLPKADFDLLRPHLTCVKLDHEAVLYEAFQRVHRAYFPHTGVISLVVDLASGETIETGMIGRDGLLGGSFALDWMALNKAVVQIAGQASVLEVDYLRSVMERSSAFRAMLMRHEQVILLQAQQSAACNAAHTLERRLARWLLRCRDLMSSDNLDLTQEFLSQMLGVRRTSVTLVASTLQKAGMIRYRRGHIQILDTDGLSDTSCECYHTVKSHSDRLLNGRPNAAK